jgi:hypothetical protein
MQPIQIGRVGGASWLNTEDDYRPSWLSSG